MHPTWQELTIVVAYMMGGLLLLVSCMKKERFRYLEEEVRDESVCLNIRWLYDNAKIAEECLHRMKDMDRRFNEREIELMAKLTHKYLELFSLARNTADENVGNN